MTNLSQLKIKDITYIFNNDKLDAEFLDACATDSRVAVQRLLKKYQREKQERERINALYQFEYAALEQGFELVAGIDEAGRGPLAGPVAVASVILPLGLFLPGLNDSKKVSAKRRESLFEEIKANAIAYNITLVTEDVIDRINIYQATVSGMYKSVLALRPSPHKVLIDAVDLDRLPIPYQPIIKGDSLSASIAAASILAKVTRDRLMLEYDKQYPEYGFANHKGYGTAEHLTAIKKYGPCPIHRKTFEPIASML